jgi:hypothetical protein
MSGRFFAMVLVLIASLLLAGCAATGAVPTAGRAAESPQPTAASLPGATVIAQGEHLQYDDPEPKFLVITTQQEWSEFWQAYRPEGETAPEVDFAKSVVLVGIEGAKSTGGYAIRFTGLEQSSDLVQVIVDMEEPAPGTSAETVLTQPYVAVEIARDRLPPRGSTTFVFETAGGQELGRVSEAVVQDGDIAPTGPRPTEPAPPASEVFAGAQVLAEGEHLQYDDPQPRFLVITTQEGLNEFWQTYLPGVKPVPQVDFKGSFVLAGIQGAKSSGGYSIRFSALKESGDTVRVITDLVEPAPDEPAEMVFTQPYIVVQVNVEQLATRGALTFIFETSSGEELARMSATVE